MPDLINTAVTTPQAAEPAQAAPPPQDEQLLNLVLENLPQAICWKNRASVFLGCNSAFAHVSGLSHPSELIGKTDYAITTPELAALYQADDKQVMESGVAQTNFEEPMVHSDGSQHWLRTSKIPLRTADGAVAGIIVSIEDITEQKQAEATRAAEREEYIQMQASALAELSTPLIPLSHKVVVMPLIGSIDSRRAQQVLETLLSGIAERSAQVAILDITGVPIVDTQVASVLIRAAQSAQLLGARVVLTGIRPEVAQTLVGLGVSLNDLITRSDLQSGIAFATQLQ